MTRLVYVPLHDKNLYFTSLRRIPEHAKGSGVEKKHLPP